MQGRRLASVVQRHFAYYITATRLRNGPGTQTALAHQDTDHTNSRSCLVGGSPPTVPKVTDRAHRNCSRVERAQDQ